MTLVPCIVPKGGDHCDFCCTSPVSTVYACTNFSIERNSVFPFGLAVGSWAACRICAELVDAGRWNDLTNRSLKKFAKRHGVSPPPFLRVRQQLHEIHPPFPRHMPRN